LEYLQKFGLGLDGVVNALAARITGATVCYWLFQAEVIQRDPNKLRHAEPTEY
jgi:hypothetical protein